MLSRIGASLLGQFIVAIQPILLVPLFLRAWGGEVYGQWCIFFAIVSYFSLLDFGCQNHVGNVLAEDFIRKNRQNFQANLSNSVSLFLFISGIGFILFLASLMVALIFFPELYFKKNQIAQGELVLIFLGGNVLLTIPAGIYSTAYRAFGRVTRSTMIANALRIIQFSVFGGALYLGCTPLIYAQLFFLFGVFGAIVNVVDLWFSFGEYVRIKISISNAKKGLKFFKGASYFWFLALTSNINQQTPIIVLGLFSSPLAVSLYVTHKTISNCLNYVGAIFQAPLWPEFSKLLVNDEKKKVFWLTLLCVRIVFFCTGILALLVWFIVPDIYSIWTAKKLVLDPTLLSIFLVQSVLMSFWSTSSWSLLAGSRQNRLIHFGVLNALLTLILSIPLSIKYGVIGCAVASLIGDLIFGLYFFPAVVSRAMDCKVIYIFAQLFKMLLPLTFCYAILYLINFNYLHVGQLFNIFSMILVCIAITYVAIKKEILLMMNKVAK